MATHEQNIENLRTAVYGEQVRGSMIELFNEDYNIAKIAYGDTDPTLPTSYSDGTTYINTESWDVFKLEVNAWVLKGNIQGADGEPGQDGQDGQDGEDGTKWYRGTAVSGKSTTTAAIDANVGDFYLNSTESAVYHCTVGGNPSTWDYDFTMSGGGGGGSSDYNDLDNRPQINSVTLTGNKTSADLSLADRVHSHSVSEITGLGSLATKSKIETSDLDSTLSGKISDIDNKVPDTRTVNGKALSSNITLGASDVGALPDNTVIPTVDQTYSGSSANAQSGVAVESAMSGIRGTWTAQVTGSSGDTTVSFTNAAIDNTKIIEVYSKTVSGAPVSYSKMEVSGTTLTVTFESALKETTNFKAWIR